MAEMDAGSDAKFIESAADFVRELANQLYAAQSDDDKDSALAKINLVLNDIVRVAKGELPDDDGKPTIEAICCRQCAVLYRNNPPAYVNCMNNCDRSC